MRAIGLLCTLALAGCSTIPAPDFQVRLSQYGAGVEGGGLAAGGASNIGGYIASVVGAPPEGVRVRLTVGKTTLQVGADDEPTLQARGFMTPVGGR